MLNLTNSLQYMKCVDNIEQLYNDPENITMSYMGMLSPAASTSDSDITSVSSTSPPHITNLYIGNEDCRPYLEILEQPVEKFRFRYKSEMVGTHGSLTGTNTDKVRKNTYPTVKLHNYEGEAIIRCSIVQFKSTNPHAHRLVVRVGLEEQDDPHDYIVNAEHKHTAVFQGMGIIHTAKKYIKHEIFKKKLFLFQEELARKHINRNPTKSDEDHIDQLAEIESKTINLNTVRLKFEAFKLDEYGAKHLICEPVFSHGINNLKSALTGDLKIVRMDHSCTSCTGGQEIFLLVEKVTKNNIKVRFYETDADDNEIWLDYGRFSHIDVHHQYAIVLRVPPYRDQNITECVEVKIQLERPSDGARSVPLIFKYKPSPNQFGRKRPRYNESVSSGELPVVLSDNSISIPENLLPKDLDFLSKVTSDDYKDLFNSFGEHYKNIVSKENNRTDGVEENSSFSVELEDSLFAKKVTTLIGRRVCEKVPHNELERYVSHAFSSMVTNAGNNALHTAIICEQYVEIQYILLLLSKMKHLKITDYQNYSQETALHLAVRVNSIIVNLLINVGADANITDNKGDTPLHVAINEKQHLETFKILIKKTNLNILNDDGYSVLHLAVLKNNLNLVKLLVNANANVRVGNLSNGNTALHFAIQEKNPEIVEFLLHNTNARLDDENYAKITPLHMANFGIQNEATEKINEIINSYKMKYNFETVIKNEIENNSDFEEAEVDEDELKIKEECDEEVNDEIKKLKYCNFTTESIKLLGCILDNTTTLQKLAKALDFDCIAVAMKVSTKMLLNYANVIGTSVYEVRKLLYSLDEPEAIRIIDEYYLKKLKK